MAELELLTVHVRPTPERRKELLRQVSEKIVKVEQLIKEIESIAREGELTIQLSFDSEPLIFPGNEGGWTASSFCAGEPTTEADIDKPDSEW